MAKITFDKVGKIYSGRGMHVQAVADMDLEIGEGEFLALLGPSGCGKSSTLRMTVGLESVTSGEIRFDGRRVNDLTPQQRNVAMGFENYSLYPNLTVEGNLRFPLEVAGKDKAAIDQRVEQVSDLLDIGSILRHKPAELSGGQQQRVSLGRALVRQPAAFILDEVMSHVDSQLKFRMLNDIAEVHRNFGRTTMYVTHDQLEALALADRIAVMNEARLQQVGTRQDLFMRPSNTFVAGFIGEPAMNLLPAEMAEGRIVICNGAMELPVTAAMEALKGRRFLLGFRPQHLRIEPDASSLRSQVRLREYLGERIVYSMGRGDALFKAVTDSGHRLQIGDEAGFALPEGRALFFDAESGQRLDL